MKTITNILQMPLNNLNNYFEAKRMLLERKIAAKDKVDKHENEIKTINSKIVYLKRKQC